MSFRTRLVATGVACSAVLAACSGSVSVGKSTISQADLQTEVAAQLAAKTNQPAPKIACPGDLDAKVGASTDCQLTAQGDTKSYPVHVVVDSISGTTANFSIQVGSTAIGDGDKTAFCNDNATLDKATSAAANANDVVAAFKANQATLDDFVKNAPSDIKADATTLVASAKNIIATNDITAATHDANMQSASQRVDAYCGQNPDGSPATSTTSPGAATSTTAATPPSTTG